LLKLAFGVHEFIDGLTSKDRESVLILDDSTIEAPDRRRLNCWPKFMTIRLGDSSKVQVAHPGMVDGSTLLPLDLRCALLRTKNKDIRAFPKSLISGHAVAAASGGSDQIDRSG
jgi:hypothetical protein